jgi:hypothetical protein
MGRRARRRPGSRLVFETRDPARRAWLEWNRQGTYLKAACAGIGTIEAWHDVTDVRPGLVTFQTTYVFESDGAVLTSTLRFSYQGGGHGLAVRCGLHSGRGSRRPRPPRPGVRLHRDPGKLTA